MKWLALVGIFACSEPRPRPTTPPPAADDPDGDRLAGAADLCPREPEVHNGVDDGDGCPDLPRARTDCVWTDELAILDRVDFDTGSAQPSERRQPILDAVAATLDGNPQLERLGVVGGRAIGEPDALASERAAAVVQALVARGVATQRLEPHGHLRGISADADRNRAVWFVVLRLDGEDTRPATGEARWNPWDPDCPAKWKAHREHGAAIDCDCLDNHPPD